MVVLRKMFLYAGSVSGCSVSQEIWIEDRQNPAARSDPLKEYAVLHVHHHAGAARVNDIVAEDLRVVDAVNARHLAAAGGGYQRDNPFFSTFIEPSGGGTLKVFPIKQWICGACGQNNFQMFARCRGGKPDKCRAPRRGAEWSWKQDPRKDAGLAKVLTLAERAVAWPSRSKKDRQRSGGLAASAEEPGGEEFMLRGLMARYRDVVAESQSGVQAVSEAAGSAGAGKSFQEARDEGGGAPHVAGGAVSASEDASAATVSGTALFGEQHPDPPPSPFTVLFVGANVEEQTKIKLDREFRQLERAFVAPRGEESWERLVHFKSDCFASPSIVMEMVSRLAPTVLHLACHGDMAGVHLSKGFLENTRLANALLVLNKALGARGIRLVIANSCMSGNLALLLAEGIDFVIHHGNEPVGDAEAIRFSDTLYCFLGRGHSLFVSFTAASLESDPYELLSSRFDPEHFLLRNDSLAAATIASEHAARGERRSAVMDEIEMVAGVGQTSFSELVSFVAEEGVKEIRRRVREDPRLGQRAESSLEAVLHSGTAAKEWVSDISQTASTGICLKVVADAMSDAETEEARSELGDFLENRGGVGGCWTVLGVRHEGSVADFQRHMGGLIGGFIFSGQDGGGQWSFCQLLLLAFMRHADFVQHTDPAHRWLDLDSSFASEIDTLDCFVDSLLSDSVKHPFLDEWGFADWMWRCSKGHRHAGAVFVLDHMVRRFEFDAGEVGVWARDVMRGWFDTDEDSQGLLDRANKFLGGRASVMDILGEAIETRSYCAFLVVGKLTALLFFEHLEARRRRADAAKGTKLDLGGFRLFVSSDRRVFGVAPHDLPSRRSLGVIQRGLRCLAGLPRESLEGMLVPLAAGGAGGAGGVGGRKRKLSG